MKAKQLREWCERMGDDADIEVLLTAFYTTNWSTEFVVDSTHEVRGVYGTGSKGGVGNSAPKIVLPASHTIRVIKHPCPVCRQDPPEEY